MAVVAPRSTKPVTVEAPAVVEALEELLAQLKIQSAHLALITGEEDLDDDH